MYLERICGKHCSGEFQKTASVATLHSVRNVLMMQPFISFRNSFPWEYDEPDEPWGLSFIVTYGQGTS